MEYLPNGTLYDMIHKNTKIGKDNAKHIFLQLIYVINYLHHEKHIVHRDLKSQNIMLDENYNIRVIDFGLSRIFETENSLLYTRCGSLATTAPEIILNQPYNNKCDIWSLGIIFYEMLCGKLPFYGNNRNALFKQILSNEPDCNLISTDLTNLIQQFLKKKSTERNSLSNCQTYSSLFMSGYQQKLNSIPQMWKLFMKILSSAMIPLNSLMEKVKKSKIIY
jgi:serine/threonine protein kinase